MRSIKKYVYNREESYQLKHSKHNVDVFGGKFLV